MDRDNAYNVKTMDLGAHRTQQKGGAMGGMIRCLKCGAILHSTFRHDFQQCDCENGAYVDGGDDYMRVGAMDLDAVKVVEHIHDEKGKISILVNKGVTPNQTHLVEHDVGGA